MRGTNFLAKLYSSLWQDLLKKRIMPKSFKFKSFGKKAAAVLALSTLITGSSFFGPSAAVLPALADDTYTGGTVAEQQQAGQPAETIRKTVKRFAGATRYETAVEISKNNWFEAYNVVLARGDDFPDALAGAVLANSAVVSGPLLLTESERLRPEVLEEIKRLNTQTVFILGGTGAVSEEVENELKANGIFTCRIQGSNRYETAASIAATAVENSSRAFLASGHAFADALSISSYAAANGIPLLLTDSKKVPEATLDALHNLGVNHVTLIGGEGVISPAVAEQLEKENFMVDRLCGKDRYLTNIDILSKLPFNMDKLIVATGSAFPDALAGSVLAARENNPILLVPLCEEQLNEQTASYLNNNRESINNFFFLGGWGVINYKIESIVKTGSAHRRISLQFWDGYSNYDTYVRQLSFVPENLTDYIDILCPNITGWNDNLNFFDYRDNVDPEKARRIVALGQSYGARVVPMIHGGGTAVDKVLQDDAKRRKLVEFAVKVVEETNADGILIDLEILAETSEQGLTSLMKELYARLHPKNKLVIVSVMARTSPAAEPWLAEYNYHDLAQYVDYIQIMSYDKHYSTSAPGPIAPLDWVRKVMEYAVSEIEETEKILLGIPYYGRAWRKNGTGWVSKSFGWAVATQTAAERGAVITRATTPTDPVGVPTFQYVDENGYHRTAYFDDRLSWGEKLKLLDEFNLGGIGGWSMGWINEVSAPELYPLLKERLRSEL